MPFTGAHPFAVLPLVRVRWLDATCLVVGSMAPDLEYFARGHMSGGKLGHAPIGIAIWCVPVTLVVALLYHRLARPALLAAAPLAIARRVRASVWPARSVVALVASAAIGAVTHLVWDAFTHPDGYAVVRISALAPYHHALQIGCSVIGLAGIAIVVARRFARAELVEPPLADRNRARWIFATCIALAAPLAVARAVAIGATSSGDLMVAPITGVLAGIVVASVAVATSA